MRSPGQMLQDSGGIEGLLQEAAKGVYRRSEQWGLGQAFRSAVQGLQSGSNSPRRRSTARWSLDEGKGVTDHSALGARIQALEERNKMLARMLQESIEDITAQANEFEKEKEEAKANKLTLSVAKLQFLQVHLENSAMPLGPEESSADSHKQSQRESFRDSKVTVLSTSSNRNTPVVSPAPSLSKSIVTRRQNSQDPETRSPTQVKAPARRPANVPTTPLITRTESPQQSPFQSSRPSLAESSYSWMLGDDGNKSNFVTAAPFSPDREIKGAVRGKTGFLFGDEQTEKSASRSGKVKGKSDKEDEDGFTLGTLKGVGKQ